MVDGREEDEETCKHCGGIHAKGWKCEPIRMIEGERMAQKTWGVPILSKVVDTLAKLKKWERL